MESAKPASRRSARIWKVASPKPTVASLQRFMVSHGGAAGEGGPTNRCVYSTATRKAASSRTDEAVSAPTAPESIAPVALSASRESISEFALEPVLFVATTFSASAKALFAKHAKFLSAARTFASPKSGNACQNSESSPTLSVCVMGLSREFPTNAYAWASSSHLPSLKSVIIRHLAFESVPCNERTRRTARQHAEQAHPTAMRVAATPVAGANHTPRPLSARISKRAETL